MKSAAGEPSSVTTRLVVAIMVTSSALLALASCLLIVSSVQKVNGAVWLTTLSMMLLVGSAVAAWVQYLRDYIDFRIARLAQRTEELQQAQQ